MSAPDKALLYKYFIEDNLFIRECADKLGLSEDATYYWVRKFGFKKPAELKKATHSRAQKEADNKRCRKLSYLKRLAPIDAFNDYFMVDSHTMAETVKHFSLTDSEFYRLQREYSLYKDQKQARAQGLKTLGWEPFSSIQARISKEDFYAYYVTENHSTEETLKHFNLKEAGFYGLQKVYDIHKEKSQQVTLTLKAKGCESASNIYSRIDTNEFIEDYNAGLPLYEILDKYDIKSWVTFSQIIDDLKLKKRKNLGTSAENFKFGHLLDANSIPYKKEFHLYYDLPDRDYYKYDFLVDSKTLVEINPSVTHNTVWSPFGADHKSHITGTYHKDKTAVGRKFGYSCVNVWDWDELNKISDLIAPASLKIKIPARKCIIREVDKNIASNFIQENHIQGNCNGIKLTIGLFYEDKLVQLISLGKPRYNKNYEYELLRLCTLSGYSVIGGASKIFKHITETLGIKSIISYCDLSKFSGNIYSVLGFKLLRINKPSVHWYNIKTKQHITDNLLRQRGFDQLFGTSYGKGTSNTELMLDAGFLPVYDCGQATYIFKN